MLEGQFCCFNYRLTEVGRLSRPRHCSIVAQQSMYVDLYSAYLRKVSQMRSDMDHTVLPANYTMPAFTPQPQNITALWLVLILPSHGG